MNSSNGTLVYLGFFLLKSQNNNKLAWCCWFLLKNECIERSHIFLKKNQICNFGSTFNPSLFPFHPAQSLQQLVYTFGKVLQLPKYRHIFCSLWLFFERWTSGWIYSKGERQRRFHLNLYKTRHLWKWKLVAQFFFQLTIE